MYSEELLEKMNQLYLVLKQDHKDVRTANINAKSPYSKTINDYIKTEEELKLYMNACLVESFVVRPTLVFDVKPDYLTPSGKTNLERMLNGEAPFDTATGQVIQLHHIGQQYESPFAELPQLLHIGTETYSILHDTKIESWRLNKKLVRLTTKEAIEHWRKRGEKLGSSP